MSLMSLSAMRRKAGQLDEARRLIDSAVMASRTVTSPYVRVIRGLIALNQGRLSDAKADAELALALDTGYTIPARSLLARVYAAQGDSARARAELARALSQLPQEDPAPTAVLYTAGALIALGRSDDALSLIERARPRGAQLWFYLRNPEFNSVRENPRFRRVVNEADPRGKESGPS
jgi:tetratricopeptide (TPR) repeat protein